jgi:hypothetical protein
MLAAVLSGTTVTGSTRIMRNSLSYVYWTKVGGGARSYLYSADNPEKRVLYRALRSGEILIFQEQIRVPAMATCWSQRSSTECRRAER